MKTIASRPLTQENQTKVNEARKFSPPRTNFVDVLRFWTALRPQEIAFWFTDGEEGEVHITFAELDQRARAIAAHLQALGMRGERALLLYPPGMDFITGFFGCLYAGCTAIPAYPPRRNRNMLRIGSIAEDATAKCALTINEVTERHDELLGESPNLRKLQWVSTDTVPNQLADKWESPNLAPTDLAVLQYTSGSTGTPKGVMLSQACLINNSGADRLWVSIPRSTAWVAFGCPPITIWAWSAEYLMPMFMGRPCACMSPMSFLQKAYSLVAARLPNTVPRLAADPTSPTIYVCKKITDEQLVGLDLSRWELAFNGAEPVRPDTIEAFTAKFAPVGFRREAFYPCYGMAETTLIITGGKKREAPVVRSYSGKPLDQKIVEPHHVRAIRCAERS